MTRIEKRDPFERIDPVMVWDITRYLTSDLMVFPIDQDQVESPTYTPEAIGFDGDGILYMCWATQGWTRSRCFVWSSFF